jgi:hypothetical protein
MLIRIACELDSWVEDGFWKNVRAPICAIRTIEYSLFQSCVSLEKHKDCIFICRKLFFLVSSDFLS